MGFFDKLGDAARGMGDIFGGPDEPGETEAEKASAEVAAKEYDFARRLDFLKDEYAERVERLGSRSMQSTIAGKANVNGQISSAQMRDQTNTKLNSAGIDPSSGRALSTNNALAAAVGEANGRGQGESQFALDNSYLRGKQNRIAMDMGDKTSAVAGLQDIAEAANIEAINDARNEFNSKAATAGAVGSMVGLGASSMNKPDGGA